MRNAVTGRVFGVVGVLALSGMLGGCGTGSYGYDSNTAGGTSRFSSLGNLLTFNSTTPPPSIALADLDEKPTCPDIEVQEGTAASRVYAAGGETNSNVKYQFSMGDVVRECSHAGGDLLIKVGIEGRALLGPAGQAGAFTAPVRIAVRNERTGKPVVSKLYQVPVTVAAGEAGAPFSIVSDPLPVPFISNHAADEYTVLVGFDPKDTGHIEGKARRKPRQKS